LFTTNIIVSEVSRYIVPDKWSGKTEAAWTVALSSRSGLNELSDLSIARPSTDATGRQMPLK